MKKQNKTQLILFIVIFSLISAFSIAAYTGAFSKNSPVKVNQTSFIPQPPSGGGPIQLTTLLDNNYYYDNENVYLYVDLKTGKVEQTKDKERTPLNIAIVIDKSGSMAEKKKLEFVKKA